MQGVQLPQEPSKSRFQEGNRKTEANDVNLGSPTKEDGETNFYSSNKTFRMNENEFNADTSPSKKVLANVFNPVVSVSSHGVEISLLDPKYEARCPVDTNKITIGTQSLMTQQPSRQTVRPDTFYSTYSHTNKQISNVIDFHSS